MLVVIAIAWRWPVLRRLNTLTEVVVEPPETLAAD
jgi:hypothetical protein